MKYIVKGPEPQKFTNWKALANENWQPGYNGLSGQEKEAVKTALMEEQGYICCYCERELTDSDSHIEHIRPQSDPTVDPLDYSNIACSCQNQTKKGEPRHCGKLKDDWYDKNRFISPLDKNCESFFEYTFDGYIQPANNDQAASVTIDKLGLNIDKLNELRKKAIEPFIYDDLSDEELADFVNGYLKKQNGKFNPFYTTIKYLFGSHIE